MEAPEKIYIEDEHGEGSEEQWEYGCWDVRKQRGYDTAYIRADLVPAWQPIETAPKDGSQFLMYVRNAMSHNRVRVGMWLGLGAGWSCYGWKDTHGNFHEPTHWMPLPKPPRD